MSVLYNFVKVDTPTFLSSPRPMEIIIAMCKEVMRVDPGEDPQVHACKLLEVIVLQCRGQIDSVSSTFLVSCPASSPCESGPPSMDISL